MGEDYNESQAYLEIFKREKAIYETTPVWHVRERTKLYTKVRYAYGDAVGSGVTAAMPKTSRSLVQETWTRRLNRAWDGPPGHDGWLKWLLFWVAVLGAIGVCGWGLVKLAGSTNEDPKPLPAGIQQRGYNFIIPANYATRANYADAHAKDLCKRLPGWNSYGEAHPHGRRDGTIVINCKIDD